MTTKEGVTTLRLEKRALGLLRKKGFVVADDATKDLFAEFSLNAELSKMLMGLVSLVISLRRAYITGGARGVRASKAYVLRARLEKAGVDKEELNNLIGRIRELTLKSSLREPQKD